MFKVSQHTVNAKEMQPVTHVLLTWNTSVSGWQTKQKTNNQETNNWNNDLFKVSSQCTGIKQSRLHQEHMCHWRGTNHCLVSKQHSKQNNQNNDLFKVNSPMVLSNRTNRMVYADGTGLIRQNRQNRVSLAQSFWTENKLCKGHN